jgi:Ran GTPase-activating protein (RanGAP) involved in mRNA processing and transport
MLCLCFHIGRGHVKYKLGKYSYDTDMSRLIQTNLATGTERQLRRNVPPPPAPVPVAEPPPPRVLSSIDLSFNAIHARAFVPLASVIMMRGLTILNLSSNEIGKDGYAAFSRALIASPSCGLRTLNLTATGLTPAAATALAPALTRQRYLQTLVMDNNELDDTSISTLASALVNHVHLQSWSLQWNVFGYKGVIALLQTCGTCPSLRSLHLGSNKIAVQAGGILITAIKAGHCRYLTSLNLFGNRLRDTGVKRLADGLHEIKLRYGT